MFTENQVRQFYVTNSNAQSPTTRAAEAAAISGGSTSTITVGNSSSAGAMQFIAGDDEAYFLYKGPSADGLQRSDLIKKCNVISVNCTAAADLAHKKKKAVITLDSNLVSSSNLAVTADYVLNIDIHNYLAMDYNSIKSKYGVARGVEGSSASNLYKNLALSLAKNFKREAVEYVKIYLNTAATGAYATNTEVTASTSAASLTGTYAAIVIEEAEQPWRRGAAPQEFVDFTVEPSTIYYNAQDVVWGKVQMYGSATYTDGTASAVTVGAPQYTIPNSKKVADMEWFFHKERGDRYGEQCWPWNIDTEYQVNPADTVGYSFVDIHYYFEGNSHNVGKSEKTLTIVCPSAASNGEATFKTLLGAAASGGSAATGLYAFLEGTGVTIKKSSSWDEE